VRPDYTIERVIRPPDVPQGGMLARMSLDLSDETAAHLRSVATATLAGVLQKRGIRSTFLSGLGPIKPGQRMLGRARTLRYLPMREDLIDRFASRQNEQRAVVESLQPGDVLVIEARNETDAGTIGDIYAMRAIQLGATGVVTDGAVRDSPALRAMDIAVYHRAQHAATYRRLHMPVDHDVAIACAGVTVLPGDVVVGDDEGVVIVPAALVDEVAAEAAKQELEEAWGMEQVAGGESTDGTFPITAARRPEFEAWLAARDAGAGS
jgi:5-oxopent-3-ene-1,2,5-tricarboxylate decarboxylase / 2-hydroxyhepta-2,4-diene-1,7-dioate isomerase